MLYAIKCAQFKSQLLRQQYPIRAALGIGLDPIVLPNQLLLEDRCQVPKGAGSSLLNSRLLTPSKGAPLISQFHAYVHRGRGRGGLIKHPWLHHPRSHRQAGQASDSSGSQPPRVPPTGQALGYFHTQVGKLQPTTQNLPPIKAVPDLNPDASSSERPVIPPFKLTEHLEHRCQRGYVTDFDPVILASDEDSLADYQVEDIQPMFGLPQSVEDTEVCC